MVHPEADSESTEVVVSQEVEQVGPEQVIELTDSSDVIILHKLVEEVMQVLGKSKKAEYTVYLKLCQKYGTGNGLNGK